MTRSKYLIALTAAAVFGFAVPLVGAASANALTVGVAVQTVQADAAGHDVAVESSSTLWKASWKYELHGELWVDSASAKISVSPSIVCDGQTLKLSSQNINPGQAQTAIHVRALYNPTAAQHSCSLRVTGCVPDHNCAGLTGSGGTFRIESGSSFDITTVPDTAAANAVSADLAVNAGAQVDAVTMDYVPPAGYTYVEADADVNFTNCILSTSPAACASATPRALSGSASVQFRLEIRQYATGSSGYCQITGTPTSGYETHTITAAEHHWHVSRILSAPISTASNCIRKFRIKVFVKDTSGNGLVVQGGSYSGSIAYGF